MADDPRPLAERVRELADHPHAWVPGGVAQQFMAEIADALAALAAAHAETERLRTIQRSISECRDDPAKAIVDADRIAGEHIIRAAVAERQLDEARAALGAVQGQAEMWRRLHHEATEVGREYQARAEGAEAALAARPAPAAEDDAVEKAAQAVWERRSRARQIEGRGELKPWHIAVVQAAAWPSSPVAGEVAACRQDARAALAALGLTVADEVRCGWCGRPAHDPADCAVAKAHESQRLADIEQAVADEGRADA